MSNKPETRLQKKIQKALKEQVGGWWIKIHGSPYQKRGLPDLHGTVKGLSIWIEVKMPGEEPTLLQATTIDEINHKGGGFAFWTTNVEDAVSRTKQYLEHQTRTRLATLIIPPLNGGGPNEQEEAKTSSRKRKSSRKISRG